MLRVELRAQPSKVWSYASPLLALALTVLIGMALFMLLGKDPLRGLQVFFWEPIRTPYAIGELLLKATPLLLIALGLAVCFRSNVWNIGAEGQFILGAIAASGVAMMADKDSSRWIVLAILFARIGFGVWMYDGSLVRFAWSLCLATVLTMPLRAYIQRHYFDLGIGRLLRALLPSAVVALGTSGAAMLLAMALPSSLAPLLRLLAMAPVIAVAWYLLLRLTRHELVGEVHRLAAPIKTRLALLRPNP